jgi:hypothetical protein
MAEPVRFSASLMVRCHPEMLQALTEAAPARLMKPAEYVRMAVIERLKADGALKLAVGAS